MLPLKANGAWAYSQAWTLVKVRPSRIVSHRPSFSPCAVAVDQRMVRPGDGRARAQQDHRVEQREAQRVEHFDALGRPHAADRVDRRREERAVEEGPEPGEEEHHLGGDEQDHAVAQVKLDDRRVIAGVRLADRVPPPAVHGDEHAGEAEDHQRTCHRDCRAAT